MRLAKLRSAYFVFQRERHVLLKEATSEETRGGSREYREVRFHRFHSEVHQGLLSLGTSSPSGLRAFSVKVA